MHLSAQAADPSWLDRLSWWVADVARGYEGMKADVLAGFPIVYDAPVTWGSVSSFFAAPIIVAVAVALAGWAVPSNRWQRRLKREIEIMSGLPDGDEKSYWETQVTWQSARLRQYRENVPRFEKIFGWLTVITVLLGIFSSLVFGARFEGPSDLMLLFFFALGIWHSINVIRGRTSQGHSGAEYPDYVERERRTYRKAEQRRRAKRRLRRMRRAEKRSRPPRT